MNKAFMPGIVPDESYPDLEDVLEMDRNYVSSALILGDMSEEVGTEVLSYINKYLHYAKS